MGSARDARRAGRYPAKAATYSRMATMARKVGVSVGSTP